MKRIILLLFVLSVGIILSKAQISTPELPLSFSSENCSNDYDIVFFQKPNVEKLLAEDITRDKNGEFYRAGVAIQANLDKSNSGTWTQVQNGRIWRLKIVSYEAVGLALDINNFYLPEGTNLFFYNESKTQIFGPYTDFDNNEKNVFASDIISDDNIIIEYFEPENFSVESSFNISDVSYLYRGEEKDIKYGESDACEVNINCPEGDNWQDEKRGVAKIYLRVGTNYGYCTGSFVNNQLQDCTTYFLTADHCGQGASVSDLAWWRFYFNYEADSCDNPPSSPSSNLTYSCEYVSSGGNGGSSGSDFYLVKLDRTTYPESWYIYFNGWDRSTTASGGGVCIHHPAGDIKKISTYTNTPTSSTWGSVPNTHWRVYWATTVTNKGVTEGGSSGSPLFNNSSRIIGTLTGGGSYCTASTYPDYYGKFSYHWESNGTTDDKKLKPWLDPNNTGITTLDGKSYNDCATGIFNNDKSENIINLYPNPTSNELYISLSGIDDQNEIHFSIFDINGRLCYEEKLLFSGNKKHLISTGNLLNGIYNLKMIIKDQIFNEKFVIIK
ncbi:MAG: T9SS type A sorting domain-containing protein [Bacteroidota bacterium]